MSLREFQFTGSEHWITLYTTGYRGTGLTVNTWHNSTVRITAAISHCQLINGHKIRNSGRQYERIISSQLKNYSLCPLTPKITIIPNVLMWKSFITKGCRCHRTFVYTCKALLPSQEAGLSLLKPSRIGLRNEPQPPHVKAECQCRVTYKMVAKT